MPNIQFNYLYRDAGNYKQYGTIILANPDDLSLEQAEALIRAKLIDGEWFYAHEWQLPDLRCLPWNDELDHGFHEFQSIAFTEEVISHPLVSKIILPVPVI